MPREQRRYNEAEPTRLCRLFEQQEQQQRIHNMDDETRRIMSTHIETIELTIESMRQPGQWMPVSLLNRCERPDDRRPFQAGLYVLVFCDVTVVVIICKWI